jgi:phosphoribosylformimino-5-aminoimidazole carboxamide ribotide isomerase
MIILPAIDIKDARCVRLFKGDFATVHKVAESAEETALSFLEAGASIIQVVDLDGALTGQRSNTETIDQIIKTGAQVELGGGIRDLDTIDYYLTRGVFRIILGSGALQKPQMVKEAVKMYGGRVCVGIDAKDGYVSVDGWTCKSNVLFTDFAKEMESIGVKNLIFTDIATDGTLAGPNYQRLEELAQAVSCDITASGGVRDIGHIKALRDMGMYGAIVGKAIYSGTLDLKQAILLCSERRHKNMLAKRIIPCLDVTDGRWSRG